MAEKEYIEREALRDRMENVDWFRVNDSGVLVHGATSEMESYLPTKEVYRVIDEAPAADVAPVVHGRWEHVEKNWTDLWRCTACGEEWAFSYDPTDDDTKVNYCPECGALMDLEGGNT